MKTANVCLAEPEMAKMKAIAKSKDITFSDLLRRVISEYLEKQEEQCQIVATQQEK